MGLFMNVIMLFLCHRNRKLALLIQCLLMSIIAEVFMSNYFVDFSSLVAEVQLKAKEPLQLQGHFLYEYNVKYTKSVR